MKKLVDGKQVSARSYYYLLDWNDSTSCLFIITEFDKDKLKDLNFHEYKQLWIHATTTELSKF